MKASKFSLVFVLLVWSTNIYSESAEDSNIVAINLKESGTLYGSIVSESRDSLRLETKNYGIVSISKKEIIRTEVEIISSGYVKVKTFRGKYYVGSVTHVDEKVIKLKPEFTKEIRLKRDHIESMEEVDIDSWAKQDKYYGIGKNFVSFGVLGSSPLLGISYERLLSQKSSIEVGLGFPGAGLGYKVYPAGVKRDKLCFYTGVVGEAVFTLYGVGGLAYVPLGINMVQLGGFNFAADVGPGYVVGNPGLLPWGNLKVGYRF